MGKINGHTLLGIELFSELSAEQREQVASKITGKAYKTDNAIVNKNDLDRDVYFIVSGDARATLFSETGKEVLFEDLSAGRMFGELSAIDLP